MEKFVQVRLEPIAAQIVQEYQYFLYNSLFLLLLEVKF